MSTDGQRIQPLDIEQELKESYLTYAMSVIVSRALPDVRDGLKPSQRRILVAMNDLNLSPTSATSKCAGIVGETMKRYHPHGDGAIYPTLVRMGQEWNSRYLMVDKQGNFGSIAGLPPAAMRYTEARLSRPAVEMLEDLERETVEFIPTYDERAREPAVLPSKFPNLLVNGSTGIAVGMATSIPPHNLSEVCDAVVRVIDDHDCTVDDLLEVLPGPDFPTGGVICGLQGIREGYQHGRSTITVRARTEFREERGRDEIHVFELPYQETRDRVRERLEELVQEGRIQGIAEIKDLTDRKLPPWKVHLAITLKRDADRDVVLNQLFQYSPLQATFSIILLALVDGQPRTLSIKELIQEYVRHRTTVIRRRTQFLLVEARKRKHLVEGLLIALANLDDVIRTIRTSADRPEARQRLMQIHAQAAMLRRTLGEAGFAQLQQERGAAESYALTGTQADAILRLQLGALTRLEQAELSKEHADLLEKIADYLRILSDERNILDIIREDMFELKKAYGDERRTEISEEVVAAIDREDLITEEMMAVTLTHRGYIKRTPLATYRAQRRGGKGITGAKTEEEDPIEHLFLASTHAYLLFFTDRGRVYWQKVYDLPQLGRASRGRAVVNLLNLGPDEKVAECIAVRDLTEKGISLVMATRKGLVKKTLLEAYSRPKRGGIIAIRLDEDDELIDVVATKAGDDLVISTANGYAIRFAESDARAMGRNTRGVKGISLTKGDSVVGMVVADRDGTLLTVCAHGYGKRTPFGPGKLSPEEEEAEAAAETAADTSGTGVSPVGEAGEREAPAEPSAEAQSPDFRSGMRYRRQSRGGKGLRDIKTTERNGPVVAIASVRDDDQVMMITAGGKIQRTPVRDIRVIGRNTQGVVIIRLDEGDTLASLAKVPRDVNGDEHPKPTRAHAGNGKPSLTAPAREAADGQRETPAEPTDTAEPTPPPHDVLPEASDAEPLEEE